MSYSTTQQHPVNCFICNGDLNDVKPVVYGDSYQTSDLPDKFKQSFACFYRLLGIHSNNEGVFAAERILEKSLIGLGLRTSLTSTSSSTPEKKGRAEPLLGFKQCCCGECMEALNSIFRLQQAIDDMKNTQMGHVEKLKTSLLLTAELDEDSLWSQLRQQLFACLLYRPSRVEVATPVTKFPSRTSKRIKHKNMSKLDIEEMAVNYIQQKHSPESHVTRARAVSPASNFDDTFSDPDDCISVLRSVPSSPLRVPSPVHQSQHQRIKPCSVVLGRISLPPSTKCILSVPPSPSPSVDEPEPKEKTERFGSRVNKMFWIVDENTLLYKFFLVKVSRGGTQLTCLEHGCSAVFQNPNYSSVFKEMTAHLEIDHLENETVNQLQLKSSDRRVKRGCPVASCQTEFDLEQRRQFRTHIIRDHSMKMVVCESCWKPIKNTSDCYRRHIWFHKSDQEKLDSEEGPPQQIVYKALKSKNGKKWKILEKMGLIKKALEKRAKQKKKKKKALKNQHRSVAPVPKGKYPITFTVEGTKEIAPVVKTEIDEKMASAIAEPLHKRCRRVNSMFWFVSDDILLYKFSLIRVSRGGTQLTCLEPECPAICCDLNYSSLFEKMTAHLETHHPVRVRNEELDSEEEPPRIRKFCPFPSCQEVFEENENHSPKFRAHIIHGHSVIMVACEICWKPIKNTADCYRRHKWHHKSEQEQRECKEGPPKQVVYKALKSKTGKKRKYLESLGIITKAGEEEEVPPKEKQTRRRRRLKTSEKQEKGYISQLVQDTLFLYKYTVIRALPGTGFFCGELDCSYVALGSWDSETLEQVKEHILNVHMGSRVGDSDYSTKPRPCPVCIEIPTIVENGPELRQHLQRIHGGTLYICECCGKPVTSVDSMDQHLWGHKNEEERALCGGISPYQLRTGKDRRSKCDKYPCTKCGKVFGSGTNLYNHMKVHVPKDLRKQLLCPECPDRFLSKNALRNHMERIHHPELTRYKYCPICNKQFYFRNTTRLTVHIQSHKNQPSFVCDLCGKVLSSAVTFRQHRKSIHEERKKYQCEFCEMCYGHRSNLTRHRTSAHADKVSAPSLEERLKYTMYEYRPDFIGPKIAFPCRYCEKAFPLRSRMRKHEKICSAGGSRGRDDVSDDAREWLLGI